MGQVDTSSVGQVDTRINLPRILNYTPEKKVQELQTDFESGVWGSSSVLTIFLSWGRGTKRGSKVIFVIHIDDELDVLFYSFKAGLRWGFGGRTPNLVQERSLGGGLGAKPPKSYRNCCVDA